MQKTASACHGSGKGKANWGRPARRSNRLITKTLLVMKLTVLLITTALFTANANGVGQVVSFSGKEVTLEKVFTIVERQTGLVFFYEQTLLKHSRLVSISAENMPLVDFLDQLFKDQPLRFSIESKTIIISKKDVETAVHDTFSYSDLLRAFISGRIVDESGNALSGATIQVKDTKRSTITNEIGFFSLNVTQGETIVITYVGFGRRELKITANNIRERTIPTIALTALRSTMKEVVVNKGFYTTSARLNTGSVGKVTAEEIERLPIANPLLALQGKIPGVEVSAADGLPGSNVTIKIRGNNSIRQGSSPLILIDGIPMAAANGFFADNFRDLDGIVFSGINPATIENINVLKDADATAIYGSRGANGVILITTKKGKVGKLSVNLNASTGVRVLTYKPKMMNTAQYLALREEAFANDGITPTTLNAPDLTLWDRNKNTDWISDLAGQQSQNSDVLASISGGSEQLQFLLSGGFHYETTPLKGDFDHRRGDIHVSISQQSLNRKFQSSASFSYSSGVVGMLVQASQLMTSLKLLPPNAPDQIDANGNLIFTRGVSNPFTTLKQTQETSTNNLNGNFTMSYQLLPEVRLSLNAGMGSVNGEFDLRYPASAEPPGSSTGTARRGYTRASSWSIYPTIEFNKNFGELRIETLLGASLQDQETNAMIIVGTNFPNDQSLANLPMAGILTTTSDYSKYRYQAVFGRIGLNWASKYILNFTGRRDGSSRFAPANRYSNFGAVGLAYIFTSEKWFRNVPVLSFGKIRSSYGITGNDQIGEYKYLDTWRNSDGGAVFNSTILQPDQLFNPDYRWEKNGKLEIAMELGFFKDRISASISYYRNMSGEQLIDFALPGITGFGSVIKNQDLRFLNTGWELSLSSTVFRKKNFQWSTSAFVSFPRTKLLAFPGIAGTNLERTNIIGKPLGARFGYQFLGLDPQTGLYQFIDVDKDGKISSPNDEVYLPRSAKIPLSAGFGNDFRFRELQVSFTTTITFGWSSNALLYTNNRPGQMRNLPVEILNLYWKKPGDNTQLQKATTSQGSKVSQNYSLFGRSDGVFLKTYAIRLQNLTVAYGLPENVRRKIRLRSCRLVLRAQNLFTISSFTGKDPESFGTSNFSPLKTFSAGLDMGI